jgi:pyruvate/2-oxoglutarate/acetoin dehydrogenase E1 component
LKGEGIETEIIDLRSVKPLDEALLFESVKKTGRLVVADGGWKTCGMAAEVSARVSETVFEYLKAPIARVTLPDSPAPASRVLEKEYYPDSKTIVDAVKIVLGG